MAFSMLITLREGLEVALIMGIIMAYLIKTGNRESGRSLWAGALAAITLSLAAGVGVFVLSFRMTWEAFVVFEGSAMFLAAAVLTYMTFWMKRQAVNIKDNLHHQVDLALKAGSGLPLAFLGFIATLREGVETVLFLSAGTVIGGSMTAYWAGAAFGLSIAASLGYLIYRGGARLPLGMFFKTSSILLILFAGGMLVNGLQEFHEVNLISPVVDDIWNTRWLMRNESLAGKIFGALFGYDSTPSLVQAVTYLSYLTVTLFMFFRTPRWTAD